MVVIWLAAVFPLLPRSPSVHPLISSFWSMVHILFGRTGIFWVVLLLDVELRWSEPHAPRKGAASYFVNKANLDSSGSVEGEFFLSSSQCHGGDGERMQEELRDAVLGRHGVLMAMNFGAQSRLLELGRPTKMTSW